MNQDEFKAAHTHVLCGIIAEHKKNKQQIFIAITGIKKRISKKEQHRLGSNSVATKMERRQ